MRVALQQTGWLKQPKVHVHASNGPASPKLTALVTKLGGELIPFAGARKSAVTKNNADSWRRRVYSAATIILWLRLASE